MSQMGLRGKKEFQGYVRRAGRIGEKGVRLVMRSKLSTIPAGSIFCKEALVEVWRSIRWRHTLMLNDIVSADGFVGFVAQGSMSCIIYPGNRLGRLSLYQ